MQKNYLGEIRPNKAKAMTTALPLTMKVCSTCSLWGGSRELRAGGYLEIHPYSKGDCQGDIFKNLAMAALATCEQWQKWSVGGGIKPAPGEVPPYANRKKANKLRNS